MASRALSSMVSRLAYSVFTLGDGVDEEADIDFEKLVFTFTRLWANALCISTRRYRTSTKWITVRPVVER